MKFILLTAALVMSMSAFAQLVKPTDDLFAKAQRDNAGKTAAQVVAENLNNYERFIEMDVNSRFNTPWSVIDANKPRTLSSAKAQELINLSEANPVVSQNSDVFNKYDPEMRFGFCFGRAAFANIFLATAGFNRANLKKAYIVGPMDKGKWGWHVTTIVQSVDKAGKEIWITIDPAAGRTMEVKAWYRYWKNDSDDGKLRLYIGESGKLGAGASKYDAAAFSKGNYNSYFSDMDEWFASHYDEVKSFKLK